MEQKKIGQFISERRKELGLTQQQLADQLGVTNKAISKWETGEGFPDITIVLDLSIALCVTADELLRGEISQNGNGNGKIPTPTKRSLLSLLFRRREKKRTHKTSPWSLFCLITGILLAMFLFTAEVEQTFGYHPTSYASMYSIALALIIGGFIVEIMNQLSYHWFLYRKTGE